MKKNKIKQKFFSLASLLVLIFSVFTPLSTVAETITENDTEYIRDKDTNTAYISSKEAEWTDAENYLAELTLSVNGTQRTKALDVAIVLDRSGSMDMNFVQRSNVSGSVLASVTSSCPCLNQEHFYLTPLDPETNPVTDYTERDLVSADKTEIIPADDGIHVIVYNEEIDKWVVLDASESGIHHQYHQFSTDTGSEIYIPYHFKKGDKGELVRISRWDTDDIRKNNSLGVWDHADENDGCYDRWMEAKKAVEKFSDHLLSYNSLYSLEGVDANRVSLIPFSVRDSLMNDDLKSYEPNYGTYLSNKGIDYSNPYDSTVNWTEDSSAISNKLNELFTTHSTDYVYGLSQAYNILSNRSEEDKLAKEAVVVLISDGMPQGFFMDGFSQYSFRYNKFAVSYQTIAAGIKAEEDVLISEATIEGTSIGAPYWQASGESHDISVGNLATNDSGSIVGIKGVNSRIVSIGYMMDSTKEIDTLQKIASPGAENYIGIPADGTGASADYLAEKLINNVFTAGGRESVLKDKVSKYFYVPEDVKLPDGVSIETNGLGEQTIVWDIGNIVEYDKDAEPTIKIPLVLKEEYRNVGSTKYYPTNADNPEPDLDNDERGPDGEDTGAKLYYKDFEDAYRYDTIGTPKLPVSPKEEPLTPTSIELKASKVLTGKKLTADAFDFELKDSKGTVIETVKNDAQGKINFKAIPYTAAGTYKYTISEVEGSEVGMTYDKHVVNVTVEVTSEDGKLVADAKYDGASTFSNVYKTPTTITRITKKILPKTGEITQISLIILGIVVLGTAIFFGNSKRKSLR